MLGSFETSLAFSEALDSGVKKIRRYVFRYIGTGVENITWVF